MRQKQSKSITSLTLVNILVCFLFAFLLLFLVVLWTYSFEQPHILTTVKKEDQQQKTKEFLISKTNADEQTILYRALRSSSPNLNPVAAVLTSTKRDCNCFFVNMTVNSTRTIGSVILKVHNDWAPLGAKRLLC